MLMVKNQKRELVVSCVGFYLDDAVEEFDHRTCVFGLMATTGVPVELGRYEYETAARVIEMLFRTFGLDPIFEMPLMESEQHKDE